MKLNEVLSEIRKGNLVFNLKVIAPKGYDKNGEEISIATTIYYKKHSKVREDDEIVVINGKEFNVSEFARNVNEFKGSEIFARLGNRSIVIECDCISGDDLRFAFLDDHGLETTDGGKTYHIVDGPRCFSYSDGYREVFVTVCE